MCIRDSGLPAERHRTVAVRGAVFVAKPVDPKDHPWRSGITPAMGPVLGQLAGTGRHLVGTGGVALQAGKVGDLGLT